MRLVVPPNRNRKRSGVVVVTAVVIEFRNFGGEGKKLKGV